MKTQIFNFFLASMIFTLFSSSVVAQNTHKQTRELYDTAVEMKTKLPTTKQVAEFRPTTRKEAEELRVVSEAVDLMERIDATKGRMTPRTKANFDRELVRLEASLDLAIGGATGGASTCHGRCDEDYPGTGGGVGWRRFVCKMGCITICIGPLCGSGGN